MITNKINRMYSEKIEKLIDLALADGELTEKEKQILFKNAQADGIDLDEFEMVLEAKLFEKQQSLNPVKETSVAPKSEKFGDVKKCPACGAIVQSFQIKCSDCEHEFRNVEANASLQKLFKMLDDVEKERENTFDSSIKRVIGLSDNINKRKQTIIQNFPIPTTKEDIFEFITFALPNTKKLSKNTSNFQHNEFVQVWRTKCGQAIEKAKIVFKNDNITLNEITKFEKQLKANKRSLKKIGCLIFLIIVMLSIPAYFIWEKRVEAQWIEEEIQQDNLFREAQTKIDKGDFEEAKRIMVKINDHGYGSDGKEELTRKIQFAELSNELEKIDSLIKNKDFEKASFALKKLTWVTIGEYIYGEQKEQIKNFLRKKEIVNSNLPVKYRIKVESIDDYIEIE